MDPSRLPYCINSYGFSETYHPSHVLLNSRFDDEAWDHAAQLADAYKIGRAESTAALALRKFIPREIVEALHECVRRPCCKLVFPLTSRMGSLWI